MMRLDRTLLPLHLPEAPEICKGDVAVFQVAETDAMNDDGEQDT